MMNTVYGIAVLSPCKPFTLLQSTPLMFALCMFEEWLENVTYPRFERQYFFFDVDLNLLFSAQEYARYTTTRFTFFPRGLAQK